MDSQSSQTVKRSRTFDSAYSFSFSIAIGLILFIAGLVITLTMGQGTSVALITAIVRAMITFNGPGKSCKPAKTVRVVPTIRARKIIT